MKAILSLASLAQDDDNEPQDDRPEAIANE
jgi:hypothetical protein